MYKISKPFHGSSCGLNFNSTTVTTPMGNPTLLDNMNLSLLDESIVNIGDSSVRNLRNVSSTQSINTRRIANIKPNAVNSNNKIVVLGEEDLRGSHAQYDSMRRPDTNLNIQPSEVDVTEVGGIPWNELKRKMSDADFDKKTFMDDLSKKDKAVLLKLAKAQKVQGNLSGLTRLTPDASKDGRGSALKSNRSNTNTLLSSQKKTIVKNRKDPRVEAKVMIN